MRNIILSIALLLSLFCFAACTQDELDLQPNGSIRFAIGQSAVTADRVQTRATPAELGKPLAEKFSLKIQRTDRLNPTYEGKFVEKMDLPIGTYSIIATCGEDVKIGRDAPYYVGSAEATIEMDKSTSAVIPCSVANALVSVNFGRDAEERARFDRHYVDFGVRVTIGSHSMTISSVREASSIYFQAGSSVELTFYGTLRADSTQKVFFPLQSDELPDVYQAADHGILTLTLPEPETSLVVQIAKAEVEKVSLEHSIPISWLPEPRAEGTHVYDAGGFLVGTDVSTFHPYPSAASKTVITNAGGTAVRSISGVGSGSSAYSSSSDWPYLNAGDYTATYYIETDGVEKAIGTKQFTIAQPNLRLTLGGYTSYTKYKDEGNVAAANACEPYTVYAPTATLNVSEALLAKYAYSFTCSYAGTAEQISAGSNTYAPGNKTGQAASLAPYVLSASASFDGVNVQANRNYYITGLPASFAPPTEAAGWGTSGNVGFESDYVKLPSSVNKGAIIHNNFAVQSGTSVQFDYNIAMHVRALTTSFSVTLGDNEILADEQYSFWASDHTYNSSKTFVQGSNATQFQCAVNVGGLGGDCYVRVYSLSLKYAN